MPRRHPRSKWPVLSVYLHAFRLYSHSLSTCFSVFRSRMIPCNVDATCSLQVIILSNLPFRFLRHTSKAPLYAVEQLLDRIQPRGVLSIEENVRFEHAGCLIDWRVLVNGGVVHKDYDVLGLGVFVGSKFVKSTVQEVVENDSVCSALRDLRWDNAVLCDCCDHRKRIARVLFTTLLSLQECHLFRKTGWVF